MLEVEPVRDRLVAYFAHQIAAAYVLVVDLVHKEAAIGELRIL